MEPYLVSRNYRESCIFMSTEALSSSAGQNVKFNVKESTKNIFYSFISLPNKVFNGFWIDKNINTISFNAKDATVPPRFLDTADYTSQKSPLPYISVVQGFKPDTVVDVKQYIMLNTMLQEEITESGTANPSEKIIESLYSEDKQKTNTLLNELFLKNFYTPHVIVGVLHIISHFNYDLVSPEGPAMAIAALNHKDVEVREYGVKCFENWQHKDGIRILEQIKADERWLQNYINLVIHDLKMLE